MWTVKLNGSFFLRRFIDVSYTADTFIFLEDPMLFSAPCRTEKVLHDQEKVMGKNTGSGHCYRGAGDLTNSNLKY